FMRYSIEYMDKNWRIALPWTLTSLVSLLAVYVWGQRFGWDAQALNAYQFFPVLGLLAYSIMWSHYVVGSIDQTVLKGIVLTDFFRYTGYVVLGAIVLHPGILIYQLFHDGYGLPPGSYTHYVAPRLAWLT